METTLSISASARRDNIKRTAPARICLIRVVDGQDIQRFGYTVDTYHYEEGDVSALVIRVEQAIHTGRDAIIREALLSRPKMTKTRQTGEG